LVLENKERKKKLKILQMNSKSQRRECLKKAKTEPNNKFEVGCGGKGTAVVFHNFVNKLSVIVEGSGDMITPDVQISKSSSNF